MSKKTQKTENQEAKITETKEQKFVRIMPKRVNVALDKLRLIKNVLASKSYNMTEEQFIKVRDTLLDSVSDIESAYNGRTEKKTDKPKFEL